MVILSSSRSREESEKELFAIISALTTELSKNKRLTDPATGLLPLAATHTFQVVPYIYDITQNETLAKNVVLRPTLGVNLR